MDVYYRDDRKSCGLCTLISLTRVCKLEELVSVAIMYHIYSIVSISYTCMSIIIYIAVYI